MMEGREESFRYIASADPEQVWLGYRLWKSGGASDDQAAWSARLSMDGIRPIRISRESRTRIRANIGPNVARFFWTGRYLVDDHEELLGGLTTEALFKTRNYFMVDNLWDVGRQLVHGRYQNSAPEFDYAVDGRFVIRAFSSAHSGGAKYEFTLEENILSCPERLISIEV